MPKLYYIQSKFKNNQATHSLNTNVQVYTNEEYYRARILHKRTRLNKRRRKIMFIRRVTLLFLLLLIIISAAFLNKWAGTLFVNASTNSHLIVTEGHLNVSGNILKTVDPQDNYFTRKISFQRSDILQPLRSYSLDQSLQTQLETLMKHYKDLTPHVFAVNLSTGEYINYNGNEFVAAASIIKLPLLLAIYRKIDQHIFSENDQLILKDYHKSDGSGSLQYKPTDTLFSLKDLAIKMMRESDNTATNMLLEKMGGIEGLNKEIKQWGIMQTQLNSWLPDLEGTNLTCPFDMATMLYNIYNPKFLSHKSRMSVENIMKNISNRHLINFQLPKETILLNKTGDIGDMLGDAGLVRLKNGSEIIIVAMVNRPFNSYSAKELIQNISQITVTHYNK